MCARPVRNLAKCYNVSSVYIGCIVSASTCRHLLPKLTLTYHFCVKNAITMLQSVQSDIRLLSNCLSQLEATSSDRDLGCIKENLDSLFAKVKSISGLCTSLHSDTPSSGNKLL